MTDPEMMVRQVADILGRSSPDPTAEVHRLLDVTMRDIEMGYFRDDIARRELMPMRWVMPRGVDDIEGVQRSTADEPFTLTATRRTPADARRFERVFREARRQGFSVPTAKRWADTVIQQHDHDDERGGPLPLRLRLWWMRRRLWWMRARLDNTCRRAAFWSFATGTVGHAGGYVLAIIDGVFKWWPVPILEVLAVLFVWICFRGWRTPEIDAEISKAVHNGHS